MNCRYTVVVIIPTGIGASVGGYAGDGIPVARAIAQIADCVITHPNVMNGALLYWSDPRILYVEGYGLDQFANHQCNLRPVHQNRVGLILDRAIESDLMLRHIQAAEATRGTLGLNISDYIITDLELGVELRTADSGASWGTIANPGSLLRAAEKLIKGKGVEAIAVVARFPDEVDPAKLQLYRQGQGVDPLGGAEAIISHLIVREFSIPCAHAPALLPLELDPSISVKSAAEELGYTFLPSVLVGLSRAPQLVTSSYQMGDINANCVNAVVFPETAAGGSAVLSFSKQSTTLLIGVSDNTTRMKVTPAALGINAIRVNSYLEALGVLVTHKAGINYHSLNPTISRINKYCDE